VINERSRRLDSVTAESRLSDWADGVTAIESPSLLLTSDNKHTYIDVGIRHQWPKKSRLDLLQGTLDLLILRTLQPGALHGGHISERIQQISRDTLQVNQGSLFRRCIASNPGLDQRPNGAFRSWDGARDFTG